MRSVDGPDAPLGYRMILRVLVTFVVEGKVV